MKSLALNCLLVVSAVCSAFGQNSDPVLMKINGKPISKSEFEYIYNKNNSNNSLEKKSLQEYAELFVNFKLKVEEAKSQGLDTTSSFKSEYLGYRAELSKPYLTDSKAEEKVLKEAYSRYLKDVNVSHILVRIPEKPTPDDTLKAWKKINEISKRLQKEDFSKVAVASSEDQGVATNQGNVGWISVFDTSYPFETACFETPLNSISKPFRTVVGYHIVKVNQIRPSQGEVMVRHIMRNLKNGSETIKDAATIIDSLYRRIKTGDDFSTLAKKYSQDNMSASNGGVTSWIKPGQMPPVYERNAFGLNEIGEISKPFETFFGWHIIQLVDKRGSRPFSEVKDYLIGKIKNNERAQLGQRALLDSLRMVYNYQVVKPNLQDFYKILKKPSLSDSTFLTLGSKLNKSLFTIAGKDFSQADFFAFIKGATTEKSTPEEIIDEKFKAYVDDQLIIYEQSQLDKKYPEFKFLMQEYHDGILLFEVNNKEVWDKSSKDVEGLSNYFKANIDKYAWDKPRFKGRLIYCRDKETFKAAQQLATKFHGDVLERYLKGRLNDSIKYVKVEKGLYAMGESKMIDNVVFKLKVDYTPAPDDSFPYVLSDGVILKTHPEDYTDVKGKLSSDYQEYLEAEWIKTLKAKYPVEINQEVLKTVKKN
jgi:peptidyl-prolyl cis-trans isomerase SurA